MNLDSEIIDSIYKIAYGLVRNKPKFGNVYDREDFIQIAVLAAVESLKRFDNGKGNLLPYLTKRMKGAIIDTIRTYMGTRKGEGYRDHSTIRFSALENAESEFDNSTMEWMEDKRVRNPDFLMEINDSLTQWKRRNEVTEKEWLLLKLRIGEGLSQCEVGRSLGYTNCSCGCSGVSHVEKRVFGRLGLKVKPIRPIRRRKQQEVAVA